MSSVKQLIVNADDFGFSAGVTDGILHAHHRGILTSTTLMTTMPDRDRAIDLAKSTPTLGVGIHLCLTQGTPLTSCHKLLNAAGQFPRALPTLARRLLSRLARQQAADEFSAQIDYARHRGLAITHLDSHKHIYHLPMLQEIILLVAERHAIPRIRAAREIRLPGQPGPSTPYSVLAHFARRLALRAQARGIATPDWFYGLASTGRTTSAVWMALLNHLPDGVGEVMIHPGYQTDLTAAETRLLESRVVELNALTDPAVRAAVDRAQVQLVHFGQLPPP